MPTRSGVSDPGRPAAVLPSHRALGRWEGSRTEPKTDLPTSSVSVAATICGSIPQLKSRRQSAPSVCFDSLPKTLFDKQIDDVVWPDQIHCKRFTLPRCNYICGQKTNTFELSLQQILKSVLGNSLTVRHKNYIWHGDFICSSCWH